MIRNTPHNNWLTILRRQNAAQIPVQFVPQNRIPQERSTLFSGENGMEEDFCQRLRHWTILGDIRA